jgi:hypothetical protein
MCCDLSVAVAVVGVFFGVSLGTASANGENPNKGGGIIRGMIKNP